ncbi:MAG: hypothetical protein ABWX63_02585 [Paeniglutamicibacter terrestris]|uniref:Uncharacterized protein n=1 Tax=Paeniglutamicibacter terrestris TaxID=2723403 RepID=A0ABX1G6Y7_9MICC|nr:MULTISPECIES: hypothetical protein [Paeniglutamicibacter]NKG22030.1 hypothetical protein [Paeniglutamicibacter terrestris]QXQ11283.1 hypothetical protein KUF55_05095 [Paeniglutamicibacter sp. Y32M11]
MKNVLVFLISFSLFVGGIYLIGEAWALEQWQWQGLGFLGGILGVTAAFMVPFVIAPRLDP